jgi:hypothetical protein
MTASNSQQRVISTKHDSTYHHCLGHELYRRLAIARFYEYILRQAHLGNSADYIRIVVGPGVTIVQQAKIT